MGTPPFPTLDPDTVCKVFATRFPVFGRVTNVTAVTKAYGHQTMLIEAGGERLLIKVAREPAEILRLDTTAAAVAAARAAGVPSPEILGTGSDERLDGRPFLAQQYWPGTDGEDAWAALSPAQREAFLVDLGQATARLHTVRGARFTEGAVDDTRGADWTAHVEIRTENLKRYNRRAGVVAPAEVHAAVAEIRRLAAATAEVVRPTLVHRDLFLRNTLVDQGRFAAILDFEHARYTDAAVEFVKLGLLLFEKHPGSEAAFKRGYGALPARFDERFRAAMGLELLGGIPFFARNKMRAGLADYQQRLHEWLPGR